MAKIEQLSSGNYRTRIYDKITKSTKSFTAPTKSEVKRMVAEYLTTNRVKSKLTVGDCIERYISGRENVVSPSTIKGYRKIQRNQLDGLKYYSADDLTSEIVQNEVSKWSMNLSPKSVRNAYGLLIAALRTFLPNKHINVTLPQKRPVEYAIPDDKEVKELISLATGDLRKAILLASIGTMRRGEICALDYNDIEGNVIHVHRDMVESENKSWIIKDIPKTAASDRYIEFPEAVIKEITAGVTDGRLIKVTPNTITQGFIRLRNKVGIECRFHDLRHYAASIMHAIGVPDQYIMQRGGWSSDSTLKRVYRNTLRDKEKEFTDKTNDYLGKFLDSN